MTGAGETESKNHTKKRIILATTSDRVEDLTRTIEVASILRYRNAITAVKAVEGTLGLEETERR